jgi:hypothetical protein
VFTLKARPTKAAWEGLLERNRVAPRTRIEEQSTDAFTTSTCTPAGYPNGAIRGQLHKLAYQGVSRSCRVASADVGTSAEHGVAMGKRQNRAIIR